MSQCRPPIVRALFISVTVVFGVSHSEGHAQDVIDKMATLDPTIHFSDDSAISIEPLLQARWTASDGVERDTVIGFSVPRARLVLTTRMFGAFRFRLRIGSSSNGSATFQQAYAQVNWQSYQVRVGQLPLKLNSGEEPAAEGLSPADYSSYSNAFAGGQTQGVEFAYRGPVRVIATLANGARSGFSELASSPLVADLATTARIEIPIGPQRVGDYDSQASFRNGQPLNARIGILGHYQVRSERGTSPANNIELAGADFGLRGSGFSWLVSASYLRLAEEGARTVENAGLMLFGSLFLSRHVEAFAQFDAIWPRGEKAPFPGIAADGQPGTTLFRTATLGANLFVVPGVHRLKLQMDLQTMFDGQTTSIVPANAALGILKTSGPQLAARLQLVVAL